MNKCKRGREGELNRGEERKKVKERQRKGEKGFLSTKKISRV